jgi:hypothetical protein
MPITRFLYDESIYFCNIFSAEKSGPTLSVSDLYFLGLYYRTQFRWNFGGSRFLRYLNP